MSTLKNDLSNHAQWFTRFTVATRLACGFGVLLVLILVVGGIGMGGMYTLNTRINDIVKHNNAKLDFAHTMNNALTKQEKDILYLVLATDSKEQSEIQARVQHQASQYENATKGLAEIYKSSVPSELEKNIFVKIQSHETAVPLLVAKVVAAAGDKQSKTALTLLHDSAKPALKTWSNDLD